MKLLVDQPLADVPPTGPLPAKDRLPAIVPLRELPEESVASVESGRYTLGESARTSAEYDMTHPLKRPGGAGQAAVIVAMPAASNVTVNVPAVVDTSAPKSMKQISGLVDEVPGVES